MNYYRKPINKVADDVKLKMQMGALPLKLSENIDKMNDLIEVDKNIKKDASSNTSKIFTNETNISSNLIELNSIKKNINVEIRKDIFDKTYILPNKAIDFVGNKIFKIFSKSIYINYSNEGVFNINTNNNYSFKNNINEFSHLYKIFDHNYKLFKEISFYHKDNLNDSVIQEKFSFKTNSTSKLQIDIYLVNNEWDSDSIDLFDYNTIRFVYNDEINSFLMNINEDNITANENAISSNSDKIGANESAISSNLEKINNISKNYFKNIYNILIHDEKTQVDFREISFEKIFEVNAKQNDFIEIDLNMLLEYENITEKIMLILFMKFLMKMIILYIFLQ